MLIWPENIAIQMMIRRKSHDQIILGGRISTDIARRHSNPVDDQKKSL
jgi:hypothetical protein